MTFVTWEHFETEFATCLFTATVATPHRGDALADNFAVEPVLADSLLTMDEIVASLPQSYRD